ncbi:hypothetical protein HNQ56_000452 [Anaerotaenia torta]|uniref:IS1096 element passenger TnpR family protein n=1 Tax=Anaerotaenia torta TaxID=433293 RepID=UPI003D1B0112
MGTQSKGRCNYCEAEYTKAGMVKHVGACKENTTLQDVDQFLRDIWLECCGHLSAFTILGESYERYPDDLGLWDEPAKSMKYQLKTMLQKGMNIGYEYDFGSTTELLITVSGYKIEPWKKEKITLLGRNNPLEFLCSECGKKIARSVCTQCMYEGTGFLCEDCEEIHECGTEIMLPVCNSPRCGVCGYSGSSVYED